MVIWGVNPSNIPKYDQNGRGPMNVQCQVQMPRWRQAISERCDKTGLCMSVWLNQPTSPISMVPALVVPCVSNLLHDPYTFLHALASKHIYIYGKCLGFARNRDHGRQRIIIIIITTTTTTIIIIIIKPLLKVFNECRYLTGVGELNPYWRSSMNVEV